MPDKARHIRTYLRGSDTAAALLDELKRRDDLLQRVRRALPETLRSHCKQASLQAGVLVIAVESPAWVSRLALLGPTLIADMNRMNIEVDRCRVRALPEASAALSPAVSERGSFSLPAAAEHVARAAEAVQSAALKESLHRLAHSLATST